MQPSYRKNLFRRSLNILWGPIERIGVVLGLLVLVSRPMMDSVLKVWEGLPWWVGALVLAGLVSYALVRAGYELWRDEEQARKNAEGQLREVEQGRESLKVALREGRQELDRLREQLATPQPEATQERSRTVLVQDEGTGTRISNSVLEVGEGYAGDAFGVASAGAGATIQNIEVRRINREDAIKAASTDAARRFYSGSISNGELSQRCRQLSNEIWDFLAERRNKEPGAESHIELMRLQTEEERSRHWENEQVERERNFRETMTEYKQRFLGRVVALLYAALQRDGCSSEEFFRWQRPPINTHCIEEATTRLAAIGNRLGGTKHPQSASYKAVSPQPAF